MTFTPITPTMQELNGVIGRLRSRAEHIVIRRNERGEIVAADREPFDAQRVVTQAKALIRKINREASTVAELHLGLALYIDYADVAAPLLGDTRLSMSAHRAKGILEEWERQQADGITLPALLATLDRMYPVDT